MRRGDRKAEIGRTGDQERCEEVGGETASVVQAGNALCHAARDAQAAENAPGEHACREQYKRRHWHGITATAGKESERGDGRDFRCVSFRARANAIAALLIQCRRLALTRRKVGTYPHESPAGRGADAGSICLATVSGRASTATGVTTSAFRIATRKTSSRSGLATFCSWDNISQVPVSLRGTR